MWWPQRKSTFSERIGSVLFDNERNIPDFNPTTTDHGHVLSRRKFIFTVFYTKTAENESVEKDCEREQFLVTLDFIKPNRKNKYGWRVIDVESLDIESEELSRTAFKEMFQYFQKYLIQRGSIKIEYITKVIDFEVAHI